MTQPTQRGNDPDNKFREGLNQLKDYTKGITIEMVTYTILAIGLVVFLIHQLAGGVIIGLIAGFTFSREIVDWTVALKSTMEREAIVRAVVLGVTLLAFFIAAPAIIIGAAAAIGLKQLYLTLVTKT